jgi:hypothetical protein
MVEQRLLRIEHTGSLTPNDSLNQLLFIGKVMIELAFTGGSCQENVIKARALYTSVAYQLSCMSKDALTAAPPS